jgi:predicted DNA-binding transcriptional regulator AlpA
MALIDLDALAALPVAAAAASSAYARAADPGREVSDRRQDLDLLEATLGSVRRLLERCQEDAERLAGQVSRAEVPRLCPLPWPVCRRCPGVRLSCSSGLGHCRRCGETDVIAVGRFRCPDPATVVVRDLTGVEQPMCLPHAAGAVRQVDRLTVVAASRPSRALLREVAGQTSVVGGRDSRLSSSIREAAMDEEKLRELPVVVDLMTAAAALGIGRTTAYEMVRTNRWPTPVLRLGNRIRIPTAALRELARLSTGTAEARAKVVIKR